MSKSAFVQINVNSLSLLEMIDKEIDDSHPLKNALKNEIGIGFYIRSTVLRSDRDTAANQESVFVKQMREHIIAMKEEQEKEAQKTREEMELEEIDEENFFEKTGAGEAKDD